MDLRPNRAEAELTALMISPDRELARQFSLTVPVARTFQILADLKAYPAQQVLDMRLRQFRPDVVLLDLATDLAAACELIRLVVQAAPATHVIGLHTRNDSGAILQSLRLGASEFLHAPFDPATQQQAAARIRRLRGHESAPEKDPGKVVLFSSAKPGSGASTLAAQVALGLSRVAEQRALLVDLDLMGGSVGFYLRLRPMGSLLDALEQDGQLAVAWPSLVSHTNGLDVLAAPTAPASSRVEQARLHDVLEYARRLYGWVVLDAPAIFHPTSLTALSECDCAFLVSTPELPSLHLARKAVNLIGRLGFGKDRLQVLINRVEKRNGLSPADMEKIFGCPIHGEFPDDYCSLDRVVALGSPLEADSELGGAIEGFTRKLAGVPPGETRRAAVLMEVSPAFSQG